jgi:CDP-diacylglycerol--glycerol-3-phosphate 3-phosphatidyltransferase
MDKRIFMKILVNFLTTGRCIFVFYLIYLFEDIQNIIFLAILGLLFFTDFMDGFLARKYQIQSNYGATMDTIADKILSIVLILLIIKKVNYLSLILIGEVIIALINVSANFVNKKTKSSMVGKIKMWCLAITIILGYGNYFRFVKKIVVNIGCLLTFCLQIYVGISYILVLSKQKRGKSRKKIKNLGDLVYRLFSTKYYLDGNNYYKNIS